MMNVFYFSSDGYAGVAAVSMLSLLEHCCNEKIHFYLGCIDVSRENQKKILRMITPYHAEISFIPLPEASQLLDFPFESRYQIGHAYARMCLGQLLPDDVSRVLCLDSDTLILDELSELWNLEMGENILAGVPDCINLKAFQRQFALEPGQIYCNSGVFLVDMNKWRSHKIESAIRQIIRQENGKVFFYEQTLMNYACRGKIYQLPLKYNCYTALYAFSYDNLMRWRQPESFYTPDEVQEAMEHPAIVHFTRNFYMQSHPWKESCEHPLKDIYRSYMNRTPWPELWKDSRSIKQKLLHQVWHSIPQGILCNGANIAYNVIRPAMQRRMQQV